MPLVDADNFGPRQPPRDGTEGTATITLTLEDEHEKDTKTLIKRNGCIIGNNQDTKNFLNLSRELADHFFIYFRLKGLRPQNLRDRFGHCEIKVHRFTKPKKPAVCEITNKETVLERDGHLFLPVKAEMFCNVKGTDQFRQFLSNHCKRIAYPNFQRKALNDGRNIAALKEPKQLAMFFPISLIFEYETLLLTDDLFSQLVEGPMLSGDEVVGWCNKESSPEKITLHTFVKLEEPTCIWKVSSQCHSGTTVDQVPGVSRPQPAPDTVDTVPGTSEHPPTPDTINTGPGTSEHPSTPDTINTGPGTSEHPSSPENERYYQELFTVKGVVQDLQRRQLSLEHEMKQLKSKLFNSLRASNIGSSVTSSNSNKETIGENTLFVRAMELDVNIESGLALRLDREYLVMKNWKHLACRLKVPFDTRETWRRNTAHSPTLIMFEMPKVKYILLTTLREKLCSLGRRDVRIMIPEKDEKVTLEDFSNKNRELVDKIACKFDIARPAKKSWYDLGLSLKINKTVLKAIERGNNPSKALFLHVYNTMPAEMKTAGKFRTLLKKLDRIDVEKPAEEYGIKEGGQQPLSELLPPDSDKMRKICSCLNESLLGAIKYWKELAYEWGIPHDAYREFDPTEKSSPTKALLEWMKTNCTSLTVGQLLEHLEEIKRYDVLEFLWETLGLSQRS